MIDLIDFGGSYISLSSIHAVIDEIEGGLPTGRVFIDYGHGGRAEFEGSALDVMLIVETWQQGVAARTSAGASVMPHPTAA
ncbi:hypothetical protein ACFVTM_13375 [Arthrobacter sp. NPDC058130]|uniref:hypothetical protein n=1 Tax=Arthrobacter sp. NPDC058130 TaxID=3346353 RepID=UPI0036F16CAA